jgi:hypothetical protein
MSAVTLQPPRKRFTRTEVQQMLDAGLFAGQRLVPKVSEGRWRLQAVSKVQNGY